jgi:two-component system sensor histidine kinase KdpD
VLSLAALAVATAVMYALRGELEKVHVALLYLVVVLGGSAAGGRALGFTLAGLAFLCFDYVFLRPYATLAVENPLDWLVLFSFLFASVVAAHLLDRARERAEVAQRRAADIERLSVIGAETLNAGRAEDALAAVAEVIRATLGVRACEVLVPGATPDAYVPLARAGAADDDARSAALAAWVSERGLPAVQRGDRTARLGAADWETHPDPWSASGDVRVLLVPLRVRDRTVGVLRVSHDAPIALDPEQRQFLRALAYYAALGVERVRLVAAAERAEAFRQADALKTSLIATVSHDLRTPLTTINLMADLVTASATSTDLQQKIPALAHALQANALALSDMVSDVLDVPQLDSGRVALHESEFALDELIAEECGLMEPLAAAGGLVLRHEPFQGALRVRADRVKLGRVLRNLLKNAIQFTAQGGVTVRSALAAEGTLFVRVVDTGIGIPHEELERIFADFVQLRSPRSGESGWGLGLAICRRLARLMGGDVTLESEPHKGSVFTVVLPAARVLAREPRSNSATTMR